MNEFAAKKLGEVLAFSQIGVTVFEKGATALNTVLGEHADSVVSSLKTQSENIIAIAAEAGVIDITRLKSEKTGAKLLSMAELYIGDEWDNSAELLEWLGFFEGAAIVHWKLVHGAGEALAHQKLSELATEGITFHTDLLNAVSSAIEEYAKQKVTA